MRRTAFIPLGAIVLVLVCAGLNRGQVPVSTVVRITKAEDERRWDEDIRSLLSHRNAAIRKRAALAAGRIGDEASVPALTALLNRDRDPDVRAMAAFALGEVESAAAADALIRVINNGNERSELRARAVEALGKIAAMLPAEQQARQPELGAVIRKALENQAQQISRTTSLTPANRLTILLGLTAALRSRPPDAGPTIARFLSSPDARVRADAANVLARLRLKDGNEQLSKLLTTDPDPNVRANAARVLGATEDKPSYEALLSSFTSDGDFRVRVSAIRAFASLKDASATEPLLKRGELLTHKQLDRQAPEVNEVLEIATTLGRLLAHSGDQAAVRWLRWASSLLRRPPEIEQALARIAPNEYFLHLGGPEGARTQAQAEICRDWRAGAAIANALGEIAALPDSVKEKTELSATAEAVLRAMLDYRNSDYFDRSMGTNDPIPWAQYAIPDVLRALAAFKPKDLEQILVAQLQERVWRRDVIVRATAADLLGDLPPSEQITRELIAAWPRATQGPLNDAALSILGSLAKQKSAAANEAIKEALDSPDYLVRRRAASLLKANGAGDFTSRIGTVKTKNSDYVYRRALSRIGRTVNVIVTTSKGSFTIELLPSEAPLTVDNFIELVQRYYFRGVTIHRVVPNFVIQDGDPRGDGNGGPGYEIRCEINQTPYERATVGMALSGKDTGGSQWFVTHAPQPHLDGGYTVFGRVIAGMDVVDKIVRGDRIESVVIQGAR